MTIRASVEGSEAVFLLETEEDLQRFLASQGKFKWAICKGCGRAFQGNRDQQQYCPKVLGRNCWHKKW